MRAWAITAPFSCPDVSPPPANRPPPLKLAVIIVYALHRTRRSNSAVMFYTLFLLRRLKRHFPAARGSLGHRLLISALMITSRVICDDTYLNKPSCVVGQGMFSLREINLRLLHAFVRSTPSTATTRREHLHIRSVHHHPPITGLSPSLFSIATSPAVSMNNLIQIASMPTSPPPHFLRASMARIPPTHTATHTRQAAYGPVPHHLSFNNTRRLLASCPHPATPPPPCPTTYHYRRSIVKSENNLSKLRTGSTSLGFLRCRSLRYLAALLHQTAWLPVSTGQAGRGRLYPLTKDQ